MSALPGRRFAAPRLAQKSLRFFSDPNIVIFGNEEFTESHDWLFLSLDTILSNRIKKLSIAFTNLGSADKMKSPRFAQMRWFYLGDKPET